MSYPPMIKPSRKGLLHSKLGVPQGQKIPEKKLEAAKNSKSPAERKEATFAENFGRKASKSPAPRQPSAPTSHEAFMGMDHGDRYDHSMSRKR